MQLSSFNRSTRYCDCNYLEIVDIHKLAEMLLTSVSTLRKGWRRLPHFYVGEGSNLKSARFDVKKVIKFLEEEAEEKRNNGTIQTQRQKERMVRPIHDGRANLQKRRIPDKVRSSGVGGKRTIPGKTSRATDTRDDPFDLCEGIK
jgi:hypothetical protein